jgi:hypothetical protein
MSFFSPPPWFWPSSMGTLALAALGLTVKAYLSYRNSLAKDSERFVSYVLGTLKLGLGRYVSSKLANQLGVRKYVKKCLSTFPTHLIIPSVDNARISIDSAYVNLSLSGAAVQRVSDESLLAGQLGSVLIFGEPGSGKSSLTKKIYRRSCVQAYTAPASSRLPLHFELRRCKWTEFDVAGETSAGEWFYQQLMSHASDVKGLHNPSFVVQSTANKRGLIVLLDGLDEIPENRIHLATEAIIDVTKRLRGMSTETMVITTARTQLRGGLARDFLESVEAIYSLEPFTPSDIFEFLRKWPYQKDSLDQTQRIFTTIHEHRTLAEMCTNPLILSMYVAQDQRYTNSENLGSVRLPDTRTEFYSSVIAELLLHRRAQQLGKGQGGLDSRRQREELLGSIALDHLYRSDDPANSISWVKAVATARSLIGLSSDHTAEAYLRALALETGIFSEERPGESLRFMHLTLCEYLAAMEMTESKSPTISEIIASALGQADPTPGTRLWETVVFGVSLLKRADRLKALTELATQHVPPELILRIVRECQAYGSPVFLDCVHTIVDQLIDVDVELWDDSWFNKVRALVICLNDPAYRRQAAGAPENLTIKWLFNQLTGSDDTRITRLFDIWLRTNPAEAMSFTDMLNLDSDFWATGRVVDALEQPEFTAYAITRLADAPAHREIWTSLLAEAGLKNSLVAETLAAEPASRIPQPRHQPGLWARSQPGLSIRRLWTAENAAAMTLYGEALSIATENVVKNNSSNHRMKLPRAALLSTVKPSEVFLWRATGRSSGLHARSTLLSSSLPGFIIFIANWPSRDPPLLLLELLPLLRTYAAILPFALWALYMRGPGFRYYLHERGGQDKKAVKSVEMVRVMLNLGLFRLPALPAQIRYAVASVHGSTIAYTRYGVDPKLPEGLTENFRSRKTTPAPTVVMVDNAAVIDLRGLHRAETAYYLLGGAFPFTDAKDLDIPAPSRPRFPELKRFIIVVMPKRYRPNVLFPSL